MPVDTLDIGHSNQTVKLTTNDVQDNYYRQVKERATVNPPHGNHEEFSPTLLALAIAAQTHRDTKAMARAKPTHNDQ
ncbi:MAG: hypothetical protein ORN54_03895 [Cyclobacteriaceae bacterium]|jgi:hypothetical protein|nr:hypothetical protein [Cyclobacteriaceae bacterium]